MHSGADVWRGYCMSVHNTTMIRKLRICAGTWRRSVRQSTDAAFYRLTFVEWLRRLQTRLASVRSTWCWQSSTIKVSHLLSGSRDLPRHLAVTCLLRNAVSEFVMVDLLYITLVNVYHLTISPVLFYFIVLSCVTVMAVLLTNLVLLLLINLIWSDLM